MWSVTLCGIVVLVVVGIRHWLEKWANPKCSGILPPGSMGFPIIGETIEFFKPHGLCDIHPFIKKRIQRYGPLFRTSLLGSNTIVSTVPEVSFEILRQENKSFVMSYPDGFTNLFGKDSNYQKPGNFHKKARQLTLQLLGTENLRRRIMPEMDRMIHEHLKLKAKEGKIFDVKDATETLIARYMTRYVISDITPEVENQLLENDRLFSWDFFSSPFNLYAWKALFKGLEGRKKSQNIVKDILRRRKASKEDYDDFLGLVMAKMEKEEEEMDEEGSIQLISGIFLIIHESVSKTTAIAVKLLSENPQVVEELKREHKAILQKRADKESQITWEEYKSMMTFTHMVINESLRFINLGPVLFRKAVRDVEVNGYTIPKDWIVLVAPTVTHFDPEIYDKPFEFNPWRWEGKELLSGSKTFMAFGGGARLCIGAEFARLQMAVYLHHLVTKYEFSLVEEANITRSPLLGLPKGIRIRLSESSD